MSNNKRRLSATDEKDSDEPASKRQKITSQLIQNCFTSQNQANPFEKSRKVKTISAYNQLEVAMKICAEVQDERIGIKNIKIKRNCEDKSERNNIEEKNESITNAQQDQFKSMADTQHSKERVNESDTSVSTNTQANHENASKSSDSTHAFTENESTKHMNVDVGASSGSSGQNASSKSSSNRDKKGGGGGASFGGFSANAHYEQENEQRSAQSSENASSKNMSGNVGVGYGSSHKNIAQQKRSKTAENNMKNQNLRDQNMKNRSYEKDTEDTQTFTEDNNDIVMNAEQKRVTNDTQSAVNETKNVFEADINYTQNPIDQQSKTEVIIEPKSKGQLSFTVNDHNSLIFLTVYIQNKDSKHWIRCIESAGYDEGSYMLCTNEINGKPQFSVLKEKLRMQIDDENELKLQSNMSKSSLASQNEKIMKIDWAEDDINDYIKYLSRKHGKDTINPDIGDILEEKDIDGAQLYDMTKKQLKSIINDKTATKVIYNELKQVRDGAISLESVLGELDYKEISEWDADTVKMYIGTIDDGKYYHYIEQFAKSDGQFILTHIRKESDINNRYNIKSATDRLAIWRQIDKIRQNKNIPEKADMYAKFEKIRTRMREEQEQKEQQRRKDQTPKEVSIVFVGQTGVGKTTLLTSLHDYGKKVPFEHIHSTKTDNQDTSTSQTQRVSKETILIWIDGVKYLIHLIDTPGLGDTSGIDADEKHGNAITNYLVSHGEFNALCMVISAASVRATPIIQYIIGEIKSKLPKEAKKNFVVALTRSSDVLPGQQSIKVIEELGLPAHNIFMINNAAYEQKSVSHIKNKSTAKLLLERAKKANKSKYISNQEQLAELIKYCSTFKPYKGEEIRKLKQRRDDLKRELVKCREVMNDCAEKVKQLIQYQERVQRAKDNMTAYKEFCIETMSEELTFEKRSGKIRTVCTVCGTDKAGCHSPCHLAYQSDLNGCSSMTNGQCGCGHSVDRHVHTYEFPVKKNIKRMSVDTNKKRKYDDAQSNQKKAESELIKINRKLEAIRKHREDAIATIVTLYRQLEEIAIVGYNESFKSYVKSVKRQISKSEKLSEFEKEGKIKELDVALEQYSLFEKIKNAAKGAKQKAKQIGSSIQQWWKGN